MSTHINDGGTFREVKKMYVNDGGTFREVQLAYVNDGGTWRLAFSASGGLETVGDFSAGDSKREPLTATAGFRVLRNGTVERYIFGSWTYQDDWSSSPAADVGDGFEVAISLNSGVIPSGPSGYNALTTTRTWTLSQSVVGTVTSNVDVTIRQIGNASNSTTFTVTLSATQLEQIL